MNDTPTTSSNQPTPVRVQPVVSHVQTISELMDDINEMKNMVLYYENRILRKRIAIEEILQGKECRESHSLTPPISSAPAGQPESGRGVTVREMIESVLPEMNGSPFWYSDLKKKCLERYPSHDAKIRRGIHPACHELFKRGTLVKVPGGIARK